MCFNIKKTSFKGYVIIIAVFFISFYSIQGQENTSFSFSAGTNIIDNSNGIDSNGAVTKSPNAPWDAKRLEYKSPFFLEAELRHKNWALSVMGTTNKFQLSRLNEAGDAFVINDYDFFAIDITNKFFVDHYLFDNESIDLYAGFGLGYHKVAEGEAGTVNVNLGFNYWFTDHFGISVQAMGKKGFDDEVLYVGNYYQYNLGLSYRIKHKKKKENLEKEKDLIIEEKSVEKALPEDNVDLKVPVVQDQAENEKEVTEEKSPLDILTEKLKAIGSVYFDRNSSYFDNVGKAKLMDIHNLLRSNPSLKLRIDSYTDSKGTEAYNEFLSSRRLNRVREYFIGLAINPSRLQGVSNGVDINSPCIVQNKICSEQDYAEQRRVEFTIEEL
jgi:OOP family OmpA-OmpF porin